MVRINALFPRLAGTLAGLALLLTISGCGNGQDSAPTEPKAVPVTVARAVQRPVPVVVRAVGNVEPLASVAIKSQVGGIITEQSVTDGQDVKQGDPLFLVDPRPFDLAVREAQSKLERDQVLLDKANADLKRYSALIEKSMIAQEQYDQTYATAKSLENTIRLNQAVLERSRLEQEYSAIRSPISGHVGIVQIHKGNVISANDDRTLCVINQLEPIHISFAVPERYLPRILALNAQAPLAVEITTAGDDTPVNARLAAMDNAVDTTTGNIQLRALYDNKDRRLWPGQFVRVGLTLDTLTDVVLVPTPAVMDGLKGSYVYVLGQDNIVEVREVQTALIVDSQTAVSRGLAPGETVVVDGQIRLAPGLKAEIKNSPPQTQQGQAPSSAVTAQ